MIGVGIYVDENGNIVVGEIPKPTREFKGKSRLSLISDYVVIDLETTGLDSSVDEILEVGAIRYQDDIEVDRFNSLVKPSEPISDFISALTGITNDMVADAPAIEDVLPRLMRFINESTVIGHNVNFDVNFIYDYSVHLNLPPFSNDFIDTLRLSRRVYPDLQNHKLNTVCGHLHIPQPVEHRAIADCVRTQACYLQMKKKIADENIDLRSESEKYASMAQRIHAQGNRFNPDSPLYGKYVAFTGTLQRMKRREAMQATADIGGICCDGVTQQTNYLVLGNNDYCKSIKGGKSNKQKKAEKMQLDGYDIQVISENTFYEMLEERASLETIQTDYDSSDVKREQDVYAHIRSYLLKACDKFNLDFSDFEFVVGSGYSSVKFLSQVVFRLKFRGRSNYISIPKSYADGLSDEILLRGSNAEQGYLRFAIDPSRLEIDEKSVYSIVRSVIRHIPKEFDCCSRYVRCSNAKRCVNEDKHHALLCGYRKLLESGIIFYGENQTTEIVD